MLQLLQLIVSGAAIGCIYALIALGFVLIYKATETVNFAQGDLMMIGGFIGLSAMTVIGLPFALAFVATIAAMALVGMGTERLVLRPLLGQPAFTVVMITIGLGYLARGVVTMIPYWGTETHTLPVPWKDEVIWIGGEGSGLVVSVEHLVIILATVALVALLYVFFRYTRLGIAMQATSQNQLAAFYMGIPVRRVNMLVWGLSSAICGVAGLLLAPITFVHANMGFVGLKAFPAAVVGGFGSIPGALVGGLVIGIVESLAGFYLPEGFKDIAAYVVVLVMLVVKPNGLFGENLTKKV
ncbi:MAG: branched-chain amino acid ABC transporter permease [Sulfuritalea sp.]|uniref:branched-chain amino acid ABC transporter permease n=1 Tax=Sulfuritalea sp. TaxID=2480090 RepID=UPI00286DA23B|nr:branched-chain amino acid ABC transporter permease [Sulfuritalea sp.]MCM2309454.1 branched-chain amino acid ABC transporter permease [Sulfuritalea sp.]